MGARDDRSKGTLGAASAQLQALKALLDAAESKPGPERVKVHASPRDPRNPAVKKKPGPKKEVIRLSRSEAKVAAAAVALIPMPAMGRKPLLPQAPDFEALRHAAARQVRAAVEAALPTIDHPRPISVSTQTAEQVQAAVEYGAAILDQRPEPDPDRGFIIGLDFGTSSVKLAVRQPYQAEDPLAALLTPVELRSDDHPYLWQSVVWFCPDTQAFSLVPIPGALPLDGFKAGLISGHANAPASRQCDVTRGEATTAFLALMLAYTLGRYAQTRPLGPIGGDHFLLANVGIPVSAVDDLATRAAFSRVIAASHSLTPYAARLNLEDVRCALRDSGPHLPPGFELVPELTAAIAGYAADPTARGGAHMLVDVGASTLDIVAFTLVGRSQASVFAAGVELLGASALGWARKAEITDITFKQACDLQFAQVYSHARSAPVAPMLFDPDFRSVAVQALYTGGGCQTDLHRRFVEEMPGALGTLVPHRPLPPTRLVNVECDVSRLLLAYGLTRDVGELHDCRLPSQIEKLAPADPGGAPLISKDQV